MKIGILTKGEISTFNYEVLNKIIEDSQFSIKLAVVDCRPELTFVEKLKKNIRRGRGGYIIIMFFQRFFGRRGSSISISDFCTKYGITILETSAPYSKEIQDKIASFRLDILLLINGFGIIKEELLHIAPLGILSYHHGDMRKYRGMPPAFWELYNSEKEMGVTVQRLAKGLDRGIPIAEKKIEIRMTDTLKTLTKRAYSESTDLMHSALLKLSDPEFKAIEIKTPGKLYTLPNLRQWMLFKLKIIIRILRN